MATTHLEEGGPVRFRAPRALDRESASQVRDALAECLQGGRAVVVDLEEVELFDSTGLSVLVEALKTAAERDVALRFSGASQEILDYFSLISVGQLIKSTRPAREPFQLTAFLGGMALPGLRALRLWFLVCVETFWGLWVRPWKGERIRWDRVVMEMNFVGAGALPINALIGFLIGLILVMQTSPNLREFGAEVYVADMVGVSVTREIGPLLVAIIAAARSGSAIAAEIGTMVVSEEVDALRQMGIHPVRFLVLPKVVALAIAVPALTVIFNVCAIVGGLLFAVFVLGLPWGAYIEHTQAAIKQADILEGIFKGAVFGAVVGQVGCALGLGVQGGSIGVGRATTFAVVLSIFLIILFDAFFVGILWLL